MDLQEEQKRLNRHIIIIIIITFPGYDEKLYPVEEFRNGIMRLPFCCNYLKVTLKQGLVPVSSPRDLEVSGWHTAGEICLMGREDSLVLVDSLPRDSVSIKILVVV